MAIGSIILNPGAAIFPDGTASNLAPQLARVKSSAGATTPYFYQLNFDAAQLEQCMWQFVVPQNYGSAFDLNIYYKMASATSGLVAYDVRLAAVSNGDATDVDAKAFGSANTGTLAVAGTAGQMLSAGLSLINVDSVATADWAVIYFARNGASGSDTATGDFELIGVNLQYVVA